MGACEHRGQSIELFGHARYIPLHAEHCPACMLLGAEQELGRSEMLLEAFRCRAELTEHGLPPDALPAIRGGATLYVTTADGFMAATQAYRIAMPSLAPLAARSPAGAQR
jgi:hypothetical protein